MMVASGRVLNMARDLAVAVVEDEARRCGGELPLPVAVRLALHVEEELIHTLESTPTVTDAALAAGRAMERASDERPTRVIPIQRPEGE